MNELLSYRRSQSFLSLHQDSVTAISVSRDGRYLASSGADSQLVIFVRSQNSFDYEVKRRLRARSAVLCLVWCEPGRLVAGTQNGEILAILVSDAERSEDTKVKIEGFTAHDRPVEFLAYNSTPNAPFKLASCGRDVVRLWSWDRFDSPWASVDLIELESASAEKPAIITSLNVATSRRATSCLFVTYFHHGIICYEWPVRNPAPRRVYWKLPILNCASCSVSPDTTFVVIYQPSRGFICQRLDGGDPDVLSTPEDSPPIYLPSAVAHGGLMIVTGSNDGKVKLWDYDVRPGTRMQTLQAQDNSVIQAITTYYSIEDRQNLFIFLGTGRHGSENHVEIWRTTPQRA
ncbi:WD40 repeat-like protein [Panus rudis PR-1116 ss-1]|nr:WD40 repeat-like protein [Panus rudis PR-1116 ss-1]